MKHTFLLYETQDGKIAVTQRELTVAEAIELQQTLDSDSELHPANYDALTSEELASLRF